jgi:hypothetical protein
VHCAVGHERVSVAFVDQVHGGFDCSRQGVCDWRVGSCGARELVYADAWG